MSPPSALPPPFYISIKKRARAVKLPGDAHNSAMMNDANAAESSLDDHCKYRKLHDIIIKLTDNQAAKLNCQDDLLCLYFAPALLVWQARKEEAVEGEAETARRERVVGR